MLLNSSLWLIDAFTNKPFQGNPAGVCLVEEFPDNSLMQKVAFEMNWSETAFLKKISTNKYKIRWFSPEDEAPICAHATLASAHFLFENNYVIGSSVEFLSHAGSLVVTQKHEKNESWIIMDFPAINIESCNDANEVDVVKNILNTSVTQILKDSLIYVAVLASEDDVANCSPDLALLKTLSCRAISITANANQANANTYDFVSRYFAPKVGIPEDPVCGSSYCRLTPFWTKIFNKKFLISRQLSRRGGMLNVSYNDSTKRVSIAGQAKTILKGKFSF
ncbi:MAG: PhzF family phenazine biosynthesis protein [Holosporales bacterium]|jgi:PhzF family phenazine biosynthesis protein|nr:PhzF family phenazine biosynthesis protein [Holosporales bacterium]